MAESVDSIAEFLVLSPELFIRLLLDNLLGEDAAMAFRLGFKEGSFPMDWSTLDFPDRLKAFVLIDVVLGRLKSLTDAMGKHWDALEPALRESFEENGMQSTNAHGRTVYTYKTLIAVPFDGVDRHDYIQTLKTAECTVPDPETIRLVPDGNEMRVVWKPLLHIVSEKDRTERQEAIESEMIDLEQRAGDLRMKLAAIPVPGTVETVKANYSNLVTETVNYQTIGAWARELPKTPLGDAVLPPELEKVVKVIQKVSLRTKKS